MGIHVRQNVKNFKAKGLIATMSRGKPTVSRRSRGNGAGFDVADAMATLRALARIYERVADGLLGEVRRRAGDLKTARALSHHLDWVAARARMVGGFIAAGDCSLTHICASPDAHTRLMPLIQLAAHHAATPGRLPVVLFLLEKIDEELRLV